MVEVGKKSGCSDTHLISNISEVNWLEIEKHKNIGLTAGASAPDILIQEFIGKMHELYDVEIKNISVANENITFKELHEMYPKVNLIVGGSNLTNGNLEYFSAEKIQKFYKQMLKYDVVKELDNINEIYTEEFIQK